MLIRADGTADRNRYMRVWICAMCDAARLLAAGPPQNVHARYRQYVDMPEVRFFGAMGTRHFIGAVCSKIGYRATFPQDGDFMRGFVSWLTLSEREKELHFFYSPEKIKKDLRGSPSMGNVRLAKVLLHECGHAVLHLHITTDRIKAGDPAPSLDPEHEQEAWLYSQLIWGILVGDHGRYTCLCDTDHIDKGWLLA